MDYINFFKGKKITLMGLGLLGRGVGDAEFLAQSGADVIVTDKKTEDELSESVNQLSAYSNITFHLGGHVEEDFTSVDMVIKAAGVPLDSPYIAAAKKAGIPVYMSTALFAKFAQEEGVTIVGVTGTRGKSTITFMIHHTLANVGRQATFGGNIRGVSTLALLSHMSKESIAVLELDSWQLQGFRDLKISPHIGIFSVLLPDHLNYYKTMEAYFEDKKPIFQFQKPGDYLFVGPRVLDMVKAADPPVPPVVPPPIPDEWSLPVHGEHNRKNASLATAALRVLGLPDEDIRRGMETFRGVEGRLEFIGEKKGVKIYNDTAATTPDATTVALHALGSQRKNLILIMGGADKELSMDGLLSEIPSYCKAVVLLDGTGTSKLPASSFQVPVMGPYDNLRSAVAAAVKTSVAGDTILFSPAFASFGMFKSEFDRGDQFVSLVKELS